MRSLLKNCSSSISPKGQYGCVQQTRVLVGLNWRNCVRILGGIECDGLSVV